MTLTIDSIKNKFSNLNNYKLINKQDYYILSFDYNNLDFLINICKDNEYIYILPDENKYSKEQLEIIDKINIDLIYSNDLNIIKNLRKYFDNSKKEKLHKFKDDYGIFREKDVYNKGGCNYDILYNNLISSNKKSEICISKISKNLLFNNKQVIDILINEIKKVNSNKNHMHYILPTDEPFIFTMIFNLKTSDMNDLQIKLELDVDPELYPYLPPKIKYISPNAKRSFVYNLSNMSILEIQNWNPTISFDWLITNIGINIDKLKEEYIEKNSEIELRPIDCLLIEFNSLIGEKIYTDIDLNFDYVKFSLTKSSSSQENKYWNSGVGYGYTGREQWNIKKYVKDRELKNKNMIKILKNINHEIKNNDDYIITIISESSLLKYIKNNICNTTLLELNKNINLYEMILIIISKIYTKLDSSYIEWKHEIHLGFESLRQDISPLLSEINNDDLLPGYLNIISVADYIKDNKVNFVKKSEQISINENEMNYNIMIKEEQDKMFDNFKIPEYHKFFSKKIERINPKSLMRISSEFSSMKKNLPNNWDTSIVLRACSDNLNLFSFIITGPKDTPYHNGIYEFHAYFPPNYPNCEPKVLLDTTGEGNVRFNPNLYNCGKVCLSLLGTWSGQDGESWNKDTSTFLQVLISIQSLILVEQPYFNEPGWERDMHTTKGKTNSFNYNDNIRYRNLQWCIVDKLKNPTPGFENMILFHFKFKKEEIIDVVNSWIKESKKFTKEMKELLNEFIELVSL